ncbi:MAG: hypothetical protein K2I43_00220 [Alistipes sp.]|nr:hypothetical protein [Alistipes sp.]
MEGLLSLMVIIWLILIPIAIFCYNDDNRRKAKANAEAMKEMLKELEREKNEEEKK